MDETAQTKSNGYGKRPLWQWVVLYVIIGAIVYGAIYYFVYAKKGGYNYNQTSQTGNQYQSTQAPTQPTTPNSSISMQEITVTGNEFAFTPSTITLKQGQQVKITFRNTGKYPHNFTISDLSVQSKTIQPGEEDSVMFTPSKTGSFTYTCTVDSHEAKGMKGTLTVQ